MTLDDSGTTCDFTHHISKEPEDRATNCNHDLKNVSRRGTTLRKDAPREAFWITLHVNALIRYCFGSSGLEVALSRLMI